MSKEINFLFRINNVDSSDKIKLSYSKLKFGYKTVIKKFSDELCECIMRDLGSNLKKNKKAWIVVNPGGSRIPNAAFLLSKEVSKRLGLNHIYLVSPLVKKYSKKINENRWIPFMRGRDREKINPIKEKNVIFIDDGLLSGEILNMSEGYLKIEGVNRVEKYILAKLEGNSEFEQEVDLYLFKAGGINRIIKDCKNNKIEYTPRFINKIVGSSDTLTFKRIVRVLDEINLIKLYLSSLEYFRKSLPKNFDFLRDYINNKYHTNLPDKKRVRGISSEIFFENILYTLIRNGNIKSIWDVANHIDYWVKSLKDTGPIKLILFDLDRTLLFSDNYYKSVRIRTREFISKGLGLSPRKVEKKIKDLKLELLKKGLSMKQFDISKEFNLNWKDLDEYIVKNTNFNKLIQRDEILIKSLEEIRNDGTKIGIITDSSYNQSINILNGLGIFHLVDKLFTPDKTGYSKPNKDFFRKALETFGVLPYQSLMVGDSRSNDLIPAKEMGMKIVLIRSKENLKSINSLIKTNETERKITNFLNDFSGFKKLFFKKKIFSGDHYFLIKNYLTMFNTFWGKEYGLSKKEILALSDNLKLYFKYSPVEDIPLDEIIRESIKIKKIILNNKNKMRRVYLGMDGIPFKICDKESAWYFIDGYSLLSRGELDKIKPFVNNLLTEHQSIIYKVMDELIKECIRKSTNDKGFYDNMGSMFNKEIGYGITQKKIVSELETQISDLLSKKGTNHERINFLVKQVGILNNKNVFREKSEEIAKDFYDKILSQFPEHSKIRIIDKAILGHQPFFIKFSVEYFLKKYHNKIFINLLTSKDNNFQNKKFRFLNECDLSNLIEVIRPIQKDPSYRKYPLTPAFKLNNDLSLIKGLFFHIYISTR